MSFITGDIKVCTIAQLRALDDLTLKQYKTFYCDEAGKEGFWEYDPNETGLDNLGTILVTGTGKRLKRVIEDDFYPEWFGAIGDGIQDDTIPIQTSINFISSLTNGGTLKFKNKTYCATKILLKRKCNIVGEYEYTFGDSSNTSYTNSALKNINTQFIDNFVEYFPDNVFSTQTGEITKLNKSIPQFGMRGVIIDGNYTCKHTLTIRESWGFKIEQCKIYNGFTYSLNISDCNEFILSENTIQGYLTLSNADYIESNNDISGKSTVPAYNSDRSGLGVTSNNKIYLGGNINPVNYFKVFGVNNGLFTVETKNYLSNNPKWSIFQTSGSLSFNESINSLIVNTSGSNSTTCVTNIGAVLIKSGSYNLSGSVIFNGVSGNRTVQFTCGNVTQIYGQLILTNNISASININFNFNPLLNYGTNPLKINIFSGDGDDTFVFDNLRITSNTTLPELNGLPCVIDYPITYNNIITQTYQHSEVFYPKYITNNTLYLYKTLYDYENNVNIPNITFNTSGSSYYFGSPNCVVHFSGKQGHSKTFNDNKIEDVLSNGIILRGIYNNVIVGNKISKGIGNFDVKLLSLIKGSSNNTISSNTISSRTNSTIDTTYISIYCDEISGNNKINNEVSNANYLDIYDNYIGEKSTQNKYDSNLNKYYSYIRKPSDYIYKDNLLFLKSGSNIGVTSNTSLISDTSEFSMLFKDVYIDNTNGDSILFQHTDITDNNKNGRLAVKISGRSIVVTINSTSVLTAINVIELNKYYDIFINKLANDIFELYLDGIKINTTIITFPTSIANDASVKSYIGSSTLYHSKDFYLSNFYFFEDALSESEISTLLSYNDFTKSDLLMNSKVSGSNTFSSLSNVTLTIDSGSGVNNGNSIKLLTQSNNYANINVNSTFTNGKFLRLSSYIKSDDIKFGSFIRKYNSKNFSIGSNYKKIVSYIFPYQTSTESDVIQLSFGDIIDITFGKSYVPTTGTVYIDYMKLYSDRFPIKYVINFNKQSVENKYYDDISRTIFYIYGQSTYNIVFDQSVQTLYLKRSTSPSNLSGSSIYSINNSNSFKLLNGYKIYSSLNSESGNTLDLNTEGSNSIKFNQSGSTKMQIFGTSNVAIGNNPTDTGDKFQVNGDTFVSGKLKLSTSGSSPSVGIATLVSGSVVVHTGAIGTLSGVNLTVQETGQYNGRIRVSARTSGSNFTISSTDNTDNCTVAWQIIN